VIRYRGMRQPLMVKVWVRVAKASKDVNLHILLPFLESGLMVCCGRFVVAEVVRRCEHQQR
jgi:hypothetical protein